MGKRAAGITRQTVLKPLGLMTTPNPYGVYPAGALSDATNVVMRAPGRVSAAPAGTNYQPITFAGLSEVIYSIAPLDNGHVLYLTYDGLWRIYEGIPGAGTPVMGTTPLSNTGSFLIARVGNTRSRDRVMFNGPYGVITADYMQPSNATQRTLRQAGMPQPKINRQGQTFNAASAIPNGIMVSYCAVVTREYADGYILKSVPSPSIRVRNFSGGPCTWELAIILPVTHIGTPGASGAQVGDFVDLYRTDGLVTASPTADPGNTFKRVFRYKLTAGDVASGYVDIVDNQPMVASFYTTTGEELYTNPYQEGSTGANRQPDACQAMATFKSFTFYGNLTERAQWTFQVPAGINDQTVNATGTPQRQYGLGSRTVAGTITNGSAVITAVNAANLVGIKVGQWVLDVVGPFPYGTKITAIGATTITMAAVATAGAASIRFEDVLELNGSPYNAFALSLLITIPGEITVNQAIADTGCTDNPGVVVTVESTTPAGLFPTDQTMQLRATNGANYSPPLPEFTATAQVFSPTPQPNLLRWSKDSEPEHVPSINETFIGSGQIIAMCATKDALWIACSDGIYRLSGDGGQWRVDTIAPGCVLCAPRCMVNVRDVVFAYTNFGFGAVTDSGFVPISDKILRSALPGSPYAEDSGMIMGFNPIEGEVYIRKFVTDFLWVYNTTSQGFTRISDIAAHLQYITAIAWQETPGSSAVQQTVIFGLLEPSTQPALIQWNSTTVKLNLAVTYHPFFGDDPFGNKQWIDICYMFSTAGAGYLLVPACSAVNFANSVPLVLLQGESECGAVCGVPRRFALAPKIEPGLSVSNGTVNAVDHLGVSVRYVPLTLQSGARK